jgi:hypothetical protein
MHSRHSGIVGLSAGLALATGMAGCAMHPLPGDLSRKSTFEIIEKIRCEGAEPLREIPRGHKFLKSVYIGYDFDFDIKENNDLGSADNMGFLKFEGTRPSGRSVSLELKGNAGAERKAQRTFRIVESFEQLQTADCSPGRAQANLLYPITGSIGMDEIVRTYVGLERLTTPGRKVNAAGAPVSIAGDPSNTPIVFSDKLIFETTLGANTSTHLELKAVGVGSFKLTEASIFGSARRKDTHKLTVVIARDPAGAEPPALQSGARNFRAENARDREQEYREAIRQYQTNPTSTFSNNLFANGILNGPNSSRYVRTLDSLHQKQLPADTRVYVELERIRSQEDEDRFLTRVIELIKPAP